MTNVLYPEFGKPRAPSSTKATYLMHDLEGIVIAATELRMRLEKAKALGDKHPLIVGLKESIKTLEDKQDRILATLSVKRN